MSFKNSGLIAQLKAVCLVEDLGLATMQRTEAVTGTTGHTQQYTIVMKGNALGWDYQRKLCLYNYKACVLGE
jgi:hypothetical protein